MWSCEWFQPCVATFYFIVMENNRYLEHLFSSLRRLDRETLLFLAPSYDRLSGSVDKLSKLDLVELIVKDRILIR